MNDGKMRKLGDLIAESPFLPPAKGKQPERTDLCERCQSRKPHREVWGAFQRAPEPGPNGKPVPQKPMTTCNDCFRWMGYERGPFGWYPKGHKKLEKKP